MRHVKIMLFLLITALIIVACGGETVEPEVIRETVEVVVTQVSEVVTEVETEVTRVVETTETVTVEVVALPPVDALSVSGDIVVAGSSTVFPLTERMAERFQDEGYTGNITIDSIGTGGGFERFCETGETDISNASRPIKEEEVAACAAIGRTPIEFRVGTDALAVVTSPSNYFAENITLAELALAFSTAETWADVNPEWPAHPIARFSPGTDSGTFDYFVEVVFEEDDAPILAAANLQLSEDDNVLVQGVTGDTCTEGDLTTACAIGYFGYAYYEENRDQLHILSIEGVEASAENVDNNSYPLARPLFIYSDATVMAEKPQVAAFINFYLTFVNEEVVPVGYFPASVAALNQAKLNWSAAEGIEVAAPSAGLTLPTVDVLAVSGDIVVAGSSTVFPLTERMAERFQDEGYAGNITIDSIGTGGGFERFCETGETDISNASRPIKEEEVAACAAIGRTPIEFRVGTDALAVVTSPSNYFAENITLAELALAFSTAETWADVNPEWPAHPIARFSPGTDSGTFDYFVEVVFEEDDAPILAAANLQLSEDDNVLVQGVTGDTCTEGDLTTACAIGYFGYAYYEENRDQLHILSIEGVEASAENVDNNSYPLARPLFIYSDATVMAEKPQVAAFINFYLTFVNEEVVPVGYFPASDDALNQARLNWLNANN
ncbi:MAG: PstS family phosphate ABC transporter substrate-binding protein [Chloroflexi bacterium]|nr:PstS family phosphate ABC transporter substrate-binding protein [Chloroflexota bacterium]MBP8058720.1 PstS family phosphate ABC transporter substrate-binding protein [Chloroflexota bacterium]